METLDKDGFKSKVFNFETHRDWKFEGKIPAIVDFYADWCGPCRMLTPILDELSKEYAGKINVYKVNTEESPEIAALFEVRSIPSLLFIPMDGLPTMSLGLAPKSELKRAINEVLKVEG